MRSTGEMLNHFKGVWSLEATGNVVHVSSEVYKDWLLDNILADIGTWGANFESPSQGYNRTTRLVP